jgi:hypothetical protein
MVWFSKLRSGGLHHVTWYIYIPQTHGRHFIIQLVFTLLAIAKHMYSKKHFEIHYTLIPNSLQDHSWYQAHGVLFSTLINVSLQLRETRRMRCLRFSCSWSYFSIAIWHHIDHRSNWNRTSAPDVLVRKGEIVTSLSWSFYLKMLRDAWEETVWVPSPTEVGRDRRNHIIYLDSVIKRIPAYDAYSCV